MIRTVAIKANVRKTVTEILAVVGCAIVLTIGVEARADVGPPVEIRMAIGTAQAVSGNEYAGVYEVHVYRAGTLADFQLTGNGWSILEFGDPGVVSAQAEVLPIPFRARPVDANEPILLTLSYNGRRVAQSFAIGPNYFDQVGKPYRSARVQDLKLDVAVAALAASDDSVGGGASGSSGASAPRSGGLQVVGRIVFSRPGRDLSDPTDGDTDDPEDIPPVLVGADTIDVRIWDSDPVGHEEIWSGYTDENGYFDTGVVAWDDGGDDPDLVLYYETETDGVVDVTDSSITEDTYEFESDEVTDFTGSFYDFGWHTPADNSLHPALHIFNGIVRTRRFIEEKPGYITPAVQVEWPDDSSDGGAWYEDETNEIHISTEREWRNDTHTHEYGHHFMDSLYDPDLPDPDYCNEYCDTDPPDDCGHCRWCPETDHDAWSEGWSSWLADVVTRDYPNRYTHDVNGPPFVPLYTRDFESPGVCGDTDLFEDPIDTEGFNSALLRDIDDAGQDDHDDDPVPGQGTYDGIFDLLCLGPNDIFYVTDIYAPVTIIDFINGFLTEYPQHTDLLWPTAFNVGGAQYVSMFPDDTQPPGLVPSCDSSTHPIGTGGPLPCMQFEWSPARDDVTGANRYSYVVTTDPSGQEPDENADNVSGTSDCRVTGVAFAGMTPGLYYFSIKARDNVGNWGLTQTFGPFEITDCNGTGLLDLCDIDCNHTGVPGFCNLSPSLCSGFAGCGASTDCHVSDCCKAGSSPGCDDQTCSEAICADEPFCCDTQWDSNCAAAALLECEVCEAGPGDYVPDECDIANGTSEDCNLDVVPDECQTMFHSNGGNWNDSLGWEENQTPTLDSQVCIDLGGSSTVLYPNDAYEIATLACWDSLNIDGGTFPWADLTLNDVSWVSGNLSLSGVNSVLRVNDILDIEGLFAWAGSNNFNSAVLTGSGVTHANGGSQICEIVTLTDHTVEFGGYTISTGRIDCYGETTLRIMPGATFEHQSAFSINSGWFDQAIDNDGTIVKTTDPGDSSIDSFLDNSGEVRVENGTLVMARYSSSTGDFVGLPGAVLEFRGGQHELLAGSSITAENVNWTSGVSGENNVRGTYNVTVATTHSGSQLMFTTEANIISYGSSFFIPNGTVNFDAPVGDVISFDVLSVGGNANFNSGDPVQVNTLTIGPGSISGPSTLTVNGLMTWSPAGHFNGPGVVNANGGVIVESGGSEKTLSTEFNNAGVATFLGPISLNGAAELSNLDGAVMDIQVDGAMIGLAPDALLDNAGMLVKSAGIGESSFHTNFQNSGTMEVQTGELAFYGNYGIANPTQTAGETRLNGGDLTLNSGLHFDMLGGYLVGEGTVTGNVVNTGGTVRPGQSAGVLDIVGSYTQGSEAKFEVEIGGTTQSDDYDWLAVTDTATLAGEMHAELIDGFVPIDGDVFEILTAGALIGAFDTVTLTGFPIDLIILVTYSNNSVVLEVAALTPGDCDEDSDVDLLDFACFVDCFSGPGGGTLPGCDGLDFDEDGDVDLLDYGVFQLLVSP